MVLMNLTPPDVSVNILKIGSPGQDNTSCTCINNSFNNSCSFIIQIASSPASEHLFAVDTYEDLPIVLDHILKATCPSLF